MPGSSCLHAEVTLNETLNPKLQERKCESLWTKTLFSFLQLKRFEQEKKQENSLKTGNHDLFIYRSKLYMWIYWQLTEKQSVILWPWILTDQLGRCISTSCYRSCCSCWCLQSERFQLISGNSSIYSLTVRRLIKRWGTAEVMEALWREACGVLTQRRHPGTMEERDESKNVAAAVGFRPRPQQEVGGAVITRRPLRNNQGAAVSCRSALWHLSLCLRGNQCCTAEPQGERWWNVSIQAKPEGGGGWGVVITLLIPWLQEKKKSFTFIYHFILITVTQSKVVSNNCIPYCTSIPHSERTPEVGLGLKVTPRCIVTCSPI